MMQRTMLYSGPQRVKLHALFEFFNVFNRQNAAALMQRTDTTQTFKTIIQVQPGREGQVGFRLEF